MILPVAMSNRTATSRHSAAPVAAVLFDIDDTLVDFTAAARLALSDAVHQYLGAHPTDDAVATAWHEINEAQYDRYLSGELDFDGMRMARMGAFLSALGHPEVDDEVHRLVESARNSRIFDHYRAFDDVQPALASLVDAGVRIGVISNSDGDYQRRKLATVGLSGVFAAEVYSGDLGIAKPARQIFLAAAAALAVDPARCAYVGDRWQADVLGARGAGMRAVWIDRGYPQGQAAGIDLTADPLITRVTGLAGLPAALERQDGDHTSERRLGTTVADL